MAETTETTITVAGMTCGHCVQAVGTEIGRVPNVTDVDVDLDSGRVVVTSTAAVDPTVLAAAVDEAGFELVQ
ncbi:MAG: heavy metal-associated domain-containing protein [Acidimicrobiales bacterium]|jgi:copper chaperone